MQVLASIVQPLSRAPAYAESCTDVASAAVVSNDDRTTSPILEVKLSTVASSSSDPTSPLDFEVAAPIPEVNMSIVVGSSVGTYE
jgi:hypothetical protein